MIDLEHLTASLERHSMRLLTAATGFMLAMFASFLIVLAQATAATAQSDATEACGGRNLIEVYAAEDPEKLAELERKAADTLYGDAVFWKIEKVGLAPSYVLGTMHMADKRIAKLEGARLEAFNASETVIVENIEALDPGQAAAAMLQHKDMTLYTDGTTLADRLDEATLAALKEASEARGMPFAMVQIMQPWLVATSVALPVCELTAKRTGRPVLDALIAQSAKDAGKTLVGLETIGEQFSAMHSLPEEFHLTALKETLKMGGLAEDVMETMKQLYLDGDIGMITPLTKAVAPETGGAESYKDFQESLITNRNTVMVERSLPYLEKGSVFIAVGALHLPDESGLVNRFAEAGYTVIAVK